MIKAWKVDPQVVLPGQDGKKGSLFDQLEDMDLDACISMCKELAAAQPAGGREKKAGSGVTQSAFVFPPLLPPSSSLCSLPPSC